MLKFANVLLDSKDNFVNPARPGTVGSPDTAARLLDVLSVVVTVTPISATLNPESAVVLTTQLVTSANAVIEVFMATRYSGPLQTVPNALVPIAAPVCFILTGM